MYRLLTILIFSFLLQGCTKLLLTAANAPKYVFEGEIKRDIAYGELPSQKLDIYLPAQLSDASNALRLPVVVFFHGGRWTTGNKGQYEFVGMRLADLGYIAVIPNTRLYPQVKFPTFIEDSAQAIAWVDDNIADYQGSNDLFVLGHSSGAHMGAMVVANQAYLAAFDKTPDIINAFAGMAGPYDFEPEAPELKDMFGPPSNYPNMQVTTFIDGSEPPMLLIYTENDSTVHIRNLELLKAGIEKANGRVETIIYDSGGHTATVGAFSWANPSGLPVAADVDTFFRAHL